MELLYLRRTQLGHQMAVQTTDVLESTMYHCTITAYPRSFSALVMARGLPRTEDEDPLCLVTLLLQILHDPIELFADVL